MLKYLAAGGREQTQTPNHPRNTPAEQSITLNEKSGAESYCKYSEKPKLHKITSFFKLSVSLENFEIS